LPNRLCDPRWNVDKALQVGQDLDFPLAHPDEKLIAKFEGQTKDVPEYQAFLNRGVAAGQSAGAGAQGQGRKSASQTAGSGLPHVTSLSGQPVETAALQGKVVVVNFWATWCVPCILAPAQEIRDELRL
jgi:thiol-disulfide isomerase/thioredoxin